MRFLSLTMFLVACGTSVEDPDPSDSSPVIPSESEGASETEQASGSESGSDSETSPSAMHLAGISGHGASGPAGAVLDVDLVVQVRDPQGAGVDQIDVIWLDGAGGEIARVASDVDGYSTYRPTLPSSVGFVTFFAQLSASSPAVSFDVLVLPGAPAALEVASGDGQTGSPSTMLVDPLTVVVRDAYGNVVPDVDVAWSATGGAVATSGGASSSAGRASATVQLGPTPGWADVVASISGGAIQSTFTAGAVPYLDNVVVTPSAPTSSDDVVASASPDWDGVKVTYVWASTGEGEIESNVLPSASTKAGQEWLVRASPSIDGLVGKPVTAKVTIGGGVCATQKLAWGDGCEGTVKGAVDGWKGSVSSTSDGLIGSVTATCVDGKWSLSDPVCDVPGLGITFYTEATHAFEMVAEIDRGFPMPSWSIDFDGSSYLIEDEQMLSIDFKGARGVKKVTMIVPDPEGVIALVGHDAHLVNEIPTGLHQLVALQKLILPNNKLTGAIPGELGQLEKLFDLDLSGNELTGSIPAALFDAREIFYLNLSNNALSGAVPAAIADLHSLSELYLHRNKLSGDLSPALSSMEALSTVDLSSNQLTGALPDLRASKSLRELRLRDNGFEDSIPAWLGGMSNLEVLDLSANGLTGGLPAALGGAEALTYLDLSQNDLTGTLPKHIGALDALTHLDLSGNAFSGPLPDEIGYLQDLTHLDLSSNDFTGALHINLHHLSALKYAAFNRNAFSEYTEGSVKGMLSLGYLNVSNNLMKGDDLDMLLYDLYASNGSTERVRADVDVRFNAEKASATGIGYATSLIGDGWIVLY